MRFSGLGFFLNQSYMCGSKNKAFEWFWFYSWIYLDVQKKFAFRVDPVDMEYDPPPLSLRGVRFHVDLVKWDSNSTELTQNGRHFENMGQ